MHTGAFTNKSERFSFSRPTHNNHSRRNPLVEIVSLAEFCTYIYIYALANFITINLCAALLYIYKCCSTLERYQAACVSERDNIFAVTIAASRSIHTSSIANESMNCDG